MELRLQVPCRRHFPGDAGVQLRGHRGPALFSGGPHVCPVVCPFTGKPHCIIATSKLNSLVTHAQRQTEPADASEVTS